MIVLFAMDYCFGIANPEERVRDSVPLSSPSISLITCYLEDRFFCRLDQSMTWPVRLLSVRSAAPPITWRTLEQYSLTDCEPEVGQTSPNSHLEASSSSGVHYFLLSILFLLPYLNKYN